MFWYEIEDVANLEKIMKQHTTPPIKKQHEKKNHIEETNVRSSSTDNKTL